MRHLPKQLGKVRTGASVCRRGIVLLAVLVVLVGLTLAAYQFSELMSAEYKAADSYTRAAQAHALAESGIHYVAALLSNTDSFSGTLNSNPFDNTQPFQDIIVIPNDKPRLQGRFSICAAIDVNDPSFGSMPFRYGVIDESGKINLNALMKLDSSGQILYNLLMKLPNMTDDVANAIIDWIDADSTPRSNGAEDDYYTSLSPPYHAKNGPLDSLEELLLVKGVTPQLLFGNDLNRNGVLDPLEDDGSGQVDRGWSAYLTIYSREQNVASDGTPRIYINDPNLDNLYQSLNNAVGQDLANYIVAYRMYGPASSTPAGSPARTSGAGAGAMPGGAPAQGGGAAAASGNVSAVTSVNVPGGTVRMATAGGGAPSGPGTATAAPAGRLTRAAIGNFNQGRPQSISSLFALINSSVSIPSSTPNAPPTRYPSPLNDAGQLQQLLPTLLDKVTTVRGTEIPARINVNTAPAAVLTALPGLAEADVQNIINNRPAPESAGSPDAIFETPAWLITKASLSANTLQTLERYITARTQVYRVQSVGYFDGGGPTARIEAVIDTNGGRPRITYWRDLTELGKGFNTQSVSSK
jgi:type II secretory pathway component PulK